jgi:hypothetical protein
MKRRIGPALLLALSLAACAPITLVQPERQTVGDVISLQPGMPWNRITLHQYEGKVELWTLDGPALNTLLIFTGVPDGQPLFARKGAGAQQEKPPVFRAGMNPIEVQELLEATAARFFNTTIAEARNPQPREIAGGRGFAFDTRLVGRDEVERAGVFAGTIRGGKLYGAWFQGAKLHYFERYRPEFERMVASAQLVGEAAR